MIMANRILIFLPTYNEAGHVKEMRDRIKAIRVPADIMNNKIHKWSESKGVLEYISPSGNTGYAPNVDLGLLGANGLAIDNDGKIILCQHGDRRLASVENIATDNPDFETIVDKYTINSQDF